MKSSAHKLSLLLLSFAMAAVVHAGDPGAVSSHDVIWTTPGKHSSGNILLLPAWPKDWDVSFKLHIVT